MAKLRLMKWWELLAPASKILLILLAIPLLTLNVWVIGAIARYFHSLVVILVGAALLAFLLNYPVSFMEHHGAKRGRAAIIVFLLAITLLGALGKVTGLNPVWVLIAILSGARVGGLLGVVVAVPIAVVIKSALQSIRPGKRPISHNSHLRPWEPAMTLTNAPTPYSDPPHPDEP
jgi:predicted PurR-regulated permease PerM